MSPYKNRENNLKNLNETMYRNSQFSFKNQEANRNTIKPDIAVYNINNNNFYFNNSVMT